MEEAASIRTKSYLERALKELKDVQSTLKSWGHNIEPAIKEIEQRLAELKQKTGLERR